MINIKPKITWCARSNCWQCLHPTYTSFNVVAWGLTVYEAYYNWIKVLNSLASFIRNVNNSKYKFSSDIEILRDVFLTNYMEPLYVKL